MLGCCAIFKQPKALAGSSQPGHSAQHVSSPGKANFSPQSGKAPTVASKDGSDARASSTSDRTTVRQLIQWLEVAKTERDAHQLSLAQVLAAGTMLQEAGGSHGPLGHAPRWLP